jgi:hypothetical protein
MYCMNLCIRLSQKKEANYVENKVIAFQTDIRNLDYILVSTFMVGTSIENLLKYGFGLSRRGGS